MGILYVPAVGDHGYTVRTCSRGSCVDGSYFVKHASVVGSYVHRQCFPQK